MSAQQQAITRRGTSAALWVVACCALIGVTVPGGAHARFTGAGSMTPNQFNGATFSPTTAPIVTVTRSRGVVTLSWTAVTISNGATVSYRVMRIANNGSSVQVCTGAAAPTTTSGTASCQDTVSGASASDKYTEQPYVQYLGTMTWSRPASTPA